MLGGWCTHADMFRGGDKAVGRAWGGGGVKHVLSKLLH